ncbi:hypothetical protein [Vibrio sp. D431a]|uniref:hypothetical protein n=1 Tax=Vibrio sp. D431a TaxID=2837388 RepID=UPI002552DA51|nr:hypothetical protein [Vibrio sp. D431a]MDK9789955.1 hypothetical protein [Vibrio sp. D431a]
MVQTVNLKRFFGIIDQTFNFVRWHAIDDLATSKCSGQNASIQKVEYNLDHVCVFFEDIPPCSCCPATTLASVTVSHDDILELAKTHKHNDCSIEDIKYFLTHSSAVINKAEVVGEKKAELMGYDGLLYAVDGEGGQLNFDVLAEDDSTNFTVEVMVSLGELESSDEVIASLSSEITQKKKEDEANAREEEQLQIERKKDERRRQLITLAQEFSNEFLLIRKDNNEIVDNDTKYNSK